MDFYSTFQPWSTFMALPFIAEKSSFTLRAAISVHFPLSASQHNVGHYRCPLRHSWYLNVNAAPSGFLNWCSDACLLIRDRVHELSWQLKDIWVSDYSIDTAAPPPPPPPALRPWAHVCSWCLLGFWVRFNGWERKTVSGRLGTICVFGCTRMFSRPHKHFQSAFWLTLPRKEVIDSQILRFRIIFLKTNETYQQNSSTTIIKMRL